MKVFYVCVCSLLSLALVGGQTFSNARFTVNDNVLESIRTLIGLANQEAVSLPNPELIESIKEIIEGEINKFRFIGQRPEYSVRSCALIRELQPCSPSGFYFIDTQSGPIAVWCEMDNPNLLPGGWMRVAMINMSVNSSFCPRGLSMVDTPRRLCRKSSVAAGCSSVFIDVHDTNYSKVCGRVRGYQFHTPEAFYAYTRSTSINPTIETPYVDGVSITYDSTPRKHIWTLAAAMDEARDAATLNRACPCTNTQLEYTGILPPYIGEDYYCETGSRSTATNRYYLRDPLWDGEGCGQDSTCCQHNRGWFCRDLGEITSSPVELRLCTNEGTTVEDILLEEIEFYVQ